MVQYTPKHNIHIPLYAFIVKPLVCLSDGIFNSVVSPTLHFGSKSQGTKPCFVLVWHSDHHRHMLLLDVPSSLAF